MDIPIWVYVIVLGIVMSAFMAIKTGREEHKEEMETIEREGEEFINRMHKEREERRKLKSLS